MSRPPARARLGLLLLVALPALLVAGLGLAHPVLLTPETAERWRLAHLLLLIAFPLLAASLWVVLRGERGPLAWAARLTALAYAVLYGALDAIAGLGAPQQVLGTDERGEGRPPIEDLFEIGDRLGELGVVALAFAGALAGVVLWQRTRSPLALVGSTVVVLACYPFLLHHVFPPRGVLAVLAIGVGLALLEASRSGQRESSANSSPGP